MLILSDKFIHKAVCLPGKPNVALMSIAFRVMPEAWIVCSSETGTLVAWRSA